LTTPALAGLTDQLTALLKFPVPVTLAVHALVCAVVTVAGAQEALTDVMVGPAMVTAAEPVLVLS
jgi:hypothetical protein